MITSEVNIILNISDKNTIEKNKIVITKHYF